MRLSNRWWSYRAACALFALLAGLVLAGPASAKTKTLTVVNDTAIPIFPSTTAESVIQFPKKGKIKDLNMSVRADVNTDTTGLTLITSKPSSTFVVVLGIGAAPAGTAFGSGACGSNEATNFDDGAAPIFTASPPFVGSFAPDGPLNANMKGRPSKQSFTLEVFTNEGTGMLYCWGLEIKYKPKS
jgi:hypothetical protein